MLTSLNKYTNRKLASYLAYGNKQHKLQETVFNLYWLGLTQFSNSFVTFFCPHDVTLSITGNGILGAIYQLAEQPINVGRECVRDEPETVAKLV